MILYLVRHGESSFNAQGRIQGQLDTPLSDLGRRQGVAVAAAFRDRPIDAIYASPLSRARQTAEPIAEALGLPLQFDDRLQEINAGIFQGLTWPEIAEQHPQASAAWKSQDADFTIPTGESRRDLMSRGAAALTAIRAGNYDQVVVVAHGGVLTAALKALLEISADKNPFSLYNGSISQIDWASQLRIITINQMEHLHAAGVDLRSRTGDL